MGVSEGGGDADVFLAAELIKVFSFKTSPPKSIFFKGGKGGAGVKMRICLQKYFQNKSFGINLLTFVMRRD